MSKIQQTLKNPNKALVLVDLQDDFFNGTMKIPHADEIIKPIKYLIRRYTYEKQLIVRTGDLHPPNHCSFKSQGGPWPEHCVLETSNPYYKYKDGRQWHTRYGLINGGGSNKFWKGQDPNKEEYSGYAATHKNGAKLFEFLLDKNIKELLIVGLALDYCVKETAMDFAKNNFKVSVYLPATRAVESEKAYLAIRDMANVGVTILN